MLCNFIRTLNEQEIATLYLLMAEVEKDRSNIQRVLSYITRQQTRTRQFMNQFDVKITGQSPRRKGGGVRAAGAVQSISRTVYHPAAHS
jgi:hypothetical protein